MKLCLGYSVTDRKSIFGMSKDCRSICHWENWCCEYFKKCKGYPESMQVLYGKLQKVETWSAS